MTTIGDRLNHTRQCMQESVLRAGRDSQSVQLLAVSKTFDAASVVEAALQGQRAFGENYAQEGVEKILATRTLLPGISLVWHCIGPLQTNKTRIVAEHFDWVQSVDRQKVAQRLSDQRPTQLPALQVCIQLNIDGGLTKAGVAPNDLLPLARDVASMPRLKLRGLMCIPDPLPDYDATVAVFARAKAVFDDLNGQGLGLDTLSMGMSEDLEAAVVSGSTMVRVGRGIFGVRLPPV